jgi:acyl-[acyl-carrier-protein] desaturase
MWTAEEDRHGSVLRDYVRDTRLFKLGELEKIQYHYLESGFTPSWDGDCYAVFVYTTIQEKATQIAHRNTGNQVAHYEPALKRILSKVAGDEARHHNFYREVLSGILQADPKGALKAMLPLFPGIDMPGVAMSSYKLMADVEYRSGIYGPFEYKRIIEELIQFLGLSKLSGLDGEAEQIRDKLMKVPARLQKVGEFYERRSQAKAFSFSFLYDRVFNLG